MVQLSTGEDFHIDVDAHTRTIDALLWMGLSYILFEYSQKP